MNGPSLSELSAHQILDIATAIERAESDIKQVIMTAARAGDCATVVMVLDRWQTCPVSEVLVGIDIPSLPPSSSLAS